MRIARTLALAAAALAVPATAHAQGSGGANTMELTIENRVLVMHSVVPGRAPVTWFRDEATGEVVLDVRAQQYPVDIRQSAQAACRNASGLVRCARAPIGSIRLEEFSFAAHEVRISPTLGVPFLGLLGVGDDEVVAQPGGTEEVLGQDGVDVLEIEGSGAFRYIEDTQFNHGFVNPGPRAKYSGFETITTGSGDDVVRTLQGDQTIRTESGDDEADGGIGNDRLLTGTGNDVLNGSTGDDTLTGDAGDDRLDGGEGRDTLTGGAGNDMLTGGLGVDTFNGGPGNDIFKSRDGEPETLPCDEGTNTYDLDLKDNLANLENCVAKPPSTVLQFAARLDTQLQAAATPRVQPGLVGPVAPEVAVGAVDEGANVRVDRGVVAGSAGKRAAAVKLACPKGLGRPCAGRVVLRIGKRTVATASKHSIASGAKRTVPVALSSAAAKVGARAVNVRVVETGRRGPKTTVATRVLGVGA